MLYLKLTKYTKFFQREESDLNYKSKNDQSNNSAFRKKPVYSLCQKFKERETEREIEREKAR